MICILAGNYQEAWTWARGQQLSSDEWFYPADLEKLMARNNFHVIVVGTAGQNVSPSYFESVFHMAKSRGKIGRT